MKICAIICEYNPFHNGHLYQLREAKRRCEADAVLCLMSGNFVQRGEAAIAEKYTRARHAVLSGADVVVDLPTVFAVANAELFAKGAIHMLSAVPEITSLCFGCENADKESLLNAAALLNDEPPSVSRKIRSLVGTGLSYAKARAEAWKNLLPENLLNAPNNILALEYTKAILRERPDIDVVPIQRRGGGYLDTSLKNDFSSASAIRGCLRNGTPIVGNLPEYVKKDLPNELETKSDALEKYAILTADANDLKKICDCTEGLENAFKKAALLSPSLSETLTSARYTSSRIRRIALHALLHISESDIRESLSAPLYFRVLSANKSRTDVLSSLSNAAPLLIRAHDEDKLTDAAKRCYEIDRFAEEIYSLLYETKNEKQIFIE